MLSLYHIVTLFLLLLFCISYMHDRRKILNGFLLNNFLISLMISCAIIAFESNNRVLMLIMGALVIFFVLIFSFGTITIAIAAILNGRILIRKEGRRFANYLSILFGATLLIVIYIINIDITDKTPFMFSTVITYLNFIILYFSLTFTSFLMSAFIYSLYRPKYNIDYIIVLGCGLINGKEVSYLLASRIDKALKFYQKQAIHTVPPKIILSGGQGSDELISEAQAMKDYIVAKDIACDDLILEDKSKNTYENMVFSKDIITRLSNKAIKILFVTNNFHVFRSAIFAKKVGIQAQGIGARTALYYWPNAMLREFIGALYINRKGHVISVSIISAIYIGFQLSYLYLTRR